VNMATCPCNPTQQHYCGTSDREEEIDRLSHRVATLQADLNRALKTIEEYRSVLRATAPDHLEAMDNPKGAAA